MAITIKTPIVQDSITKAVVETIIIDHSDGAVRVTISKRTSKDAVAGKQTVDLSASYPAIAASQFMTDIEGMVAAKLKADGLNV